MAEWFPKAVQWLYDPRLAIPLAVGGGVARLFGNETFGDPLLIYSAIAITLAITTWFATVVRNRRIVKGLSQPTRSALLDAFDKNQRWMTSDKFSESALIELEQSGVADMIISSFMGGSRKTLVRLSFWREVVLRCGRDNSPQS